MTKCQGCKKSIRDAEWFRVTHAQETVAGEYHEECWWTKEQALPDDGISQKWVARRVQGGG